MGYRTYRAIRLLVFIYIALFSALFFDYSKWISIPILIVCLLTMWLEDEDSEIGLVATYVYTIAALNILILFGYSNMGSWFLIILLGLFLLLIAIIRHKEEKEQEVAKIFLFSMLYGLVALCVIKSPFIDIVLFIFPICLILIWYIVISLLHEYEEPNDDDEYGCLAFLQTA